MGSAVRRPHDEGVGPAAGGGLDQPPHDGAEAEDREDGTGHVDVVVRGVGCEAGDQDRAGHQGDAEERQVDEEDRAPAEVLEQQAARDGPQRDRQPRHRSPQGDGAGPLAGIGEHVGEDRQRGRHHERGARAHDRPGQDQLVGGGGERRGERAGGEDAQADEQRALAAAPVAQRAGGEQQPGEHQGVGVDDPLQLAGGGLEVA
jgi:hypothetical protein